VSGISANTAYTFSVQYLRVSGAPTLRFQIQAFNSGTNLGLMSFATTAQLGVTDSAGWQTASITLTTPANTNRILWFMQDGNDYAGYTHTFEIRNVQLEQKTYPTAFAVGTRGTTVATGGGVIDLSGRSINGAIANGPTYSPANGGGLIFDGTNDYIETAATTINGGQTFISWAEATGPANSPAGILTQHNYAATANFGINYLSNYKLGASIGYTDGTREYQSKTTNYAVTLNQVFCVALVYNPTENKIYWYVNGAPDSSHQLSATPKSTNYPIALGRWDAGYGAYHFTGKIYSGIVYNRALSAQEILQNYNATRQRFITRAAPVTTSLVLHLDASDRDSYGGTGTSWKDISGYGNNGTLANG
jgi:hypothetical protein